jgi:hypothetical protein
MLSIRGTGLALGLCAMVVALQAAARAHEKITVGSLQLTVGWSDEPPFAGSRNSIDIVVSDGSGSPVADQTGVLSVEVSFGDRRTMLPLLPVEHQPGRFRAWFVPSRVGSYVFHITGRQRGEAIDITAACSEKTFPCVIDPADSQFPEKDPSTSELADRIVRSQPRLQGAIDDAADARMLSFAALGAAAAAVVLAVVLRSRSRRGRTSLDRGVREMTDDRGRRYRA